jgi:hypothetical protein
MKSIAFPLEIIDGGLAIDENPEEIIQSEILAVLYTRKKERVYRQTYGTPNFLLRKLDINYLLIELNSALEYSLSRLGYAQILVEVDSDIADLQEGKVNLIISYRIGDSLLKSAFLVDLNIG